MHHSKGAGKRRREGAVEGKRSLLSEKRRRRQLQAPTSFLRKRCRGGRRWNEGEEGDLLRLGRMRRRAKRLSRPLSPSPTSRPSHRPMLENVPPHLPFTDGFPLEFAPVPHPQ